MGGRQVKSLSREVDFDTFLVKPAKQKIRESLVLHNKGILGGVKNDWELLLKDLIV